MRRSFRVDIHSRNVTYDILFGKMERLTHQNTSWDAAKFEVCTHKWADLSEGNYRAGNTVKEGYLLNTPLQAAFIDANDGVLADNYTMIRCDRENVLIETIKKAEECWNVRSSLLKLWMVR